MGDGSDGGDSGMGDGFGGDAGVAGMAGTGTDGFGGYGGGEVGDWGGVDNDAAMGPASFAGFMGDFSGMDNDAAQGPNDAVAAGLDAGNYGNAFNDSFLGKMFSILNTPIGKAAQIGISIANPAMGKALGILGMMNSASQGKGAGAMGAGFGSAIGNASGNPAAGFLGGIAGNAALGGFNGTGTASDAGFGSNGLGGDLLGGLGSLYAGYKGMQGAGDMLGGLQSLYQQNSPYAQAMRQSLARRDAAAGRRSQYGPREVELQAKLAQMASSQIPAMTQLNSQKAMMQALMMKNAGDMFNKIGGWNGLQSLFGFGGGNIPMNGGISPEQLSSMFTPLQSLDLPEINFGG